MNPFNDKITRATRHLALTLLASFLLVSCGGGGSQTLSTTATSTTATEVIGLSGGSITSSNGAIITINPSVVQDGTRITVTISAPPPSSSPEIAPASSQISVEIPANALSATNTAVDSGILIDIPLSDTAAVGVSAQAALGVAPIKTSYRYIKTQIGTTIVYGKYVTKVVSNKVVATTKITYQYVKQQVTQGNPYVINFMVNTFSPNVPTAGTLFEITGIGPNDYVDSLNPKTAVPAGKLPLVLVHGIQFGCDGNAEAYKATWEEFRKFFFSNLGQPLRDKYQLYTFSYQTDLSIKENGRLFANVLKVSFGSLPAVVLAHSMGGLVTRSAILHHEIIGANIGGIITLGTPHHGTKTVHSVAALADHACFFATDAQGAKDLSWDRFDDPAYDPNTMPSVNPFLVGADGINTLESAYAQNHPGYYQRLLPYAGTIISPAQAIDLPQCPSLIGKMLLGKLVLPPGILRTPLYICSAAGILDYLATWDEVVPEVSARYQDYVNGAYLDKPSWSSLPRTYTGIVHSSLLGAPSLYDSSWVFLENPDTTAGGITTDLLNLYSTVLPAPVPATVTLTAIPSSIANGATSTISWTSTNSISCTSAGGGGTGITGTFTTPSLTTTTTYTVTCTGAGGSASRSATVTVAGAVAPTVTLTASLPFIASGATSTISWTSTNSTSCFSSGGGGTGITGAFTTPPLTATTTYTVTCTGVGGTTTQTATATVAGAGSFSSVAGGCVRDSVTGLMWEVKTADGGLRDWAKTYTNYDGTLNYDSTLINSPTNSVGFKNAVNAQGLCGFSDWRLPTVDELQGIVKLGSVPTIDAAWFPNTLPYYYWSASLIFDAVESVNFNSGGVALGFRFDRRHVRLVRDTVTMASVAGGCVLDSTTGLMWEVKTADGGLRDWNKTYTNYDSILSAQKFNFVTNVSSNPVQAEIDALTNSVGFKNAVNAQGMCGFSDWRLPTIDELQSIVKLGSVPTIDAAWFPNTQANSFWSASPYAYFGRSNFAWVVYFRDGSGDFNYRGNSASVRLVRAAQ